MPANDFSLSLIVGGVRSGKSTHGERLTLALPGPHYYLATAKVQAGDGEMQARVDAHKKRRELQGWAGCVEESFDIEGVFKNAAMGSAWLLECLPLWLAANAFTPDAPMQDEAWVHRRCERLLDIWRSRKLHVVAVSAESSLGLMPMDAVGRRWIDLLGRMNQTLAAQASDVWFCSCGIPMKIKGNC